MSVKGDIRATSFSSAESPQEWFDEASPDLVIIDLQMPDIDGAAFVRNFRALPGAGDIPLMVIASEERRDDCHRLLEAGATDFLLRPVDQTEFKVRAKNLLTMREQQRRLRSAITAEFGGTAPPTDLPDRGVYRQYLENTLMQALRREAKCAILVIDLDRFKGVNDAFGLSFGDRLLKVVASRLAQHLGETNVAGHLGGGQFAVLQMDIDGREESRRLAAKLKERLSEPFVVDGETLHISASLGITMFPADGYKADRLLRNAELAMHRAKAIGRNAICFYAPKMNFVARRTGLLERELRQAVVDGQFTVYYQPCQAILDDRILGMEALLRWRHPRRGMVRPTEFIGIAETIGLINAITECVLEQSCRQHRSWTEEGLPPLRLAVNLSPIQFREEGVVDLVKTMLERTGIAPETLEIELTEGVMLENSRVAIDSLTRLNDLGVTFSLDDFGTGYSSLTYVKRLPVQRLKIDQSFVHRLGQDGQDDAIVRAIIDLGHSLDLKITAEGVETSEQLDRLRVLGCDEVQGDLISPPLPAEAFSSLFSKLGSNAMAPS